MTTILEEVYFLPPIAVARVGNSPEPVAAYDWVRSREPHGGSRTMVRLATSLRVLDDGSVEPYRPVNANNEVGIAFKDEQGQICPVAPFFELWASVRDAQSPDRKDVPLTLAMLEELGLTPDHFAFTVTTANRKAERRTGSPTCAFIARVDVHGSNYAATPLLAISPHTSGQVPLVPADRPIPLGSFQVIRPVSRTNPDFDVDVSAMRVRFTPPKGEVYGPPAATSAPASPVPPGVAEAHNTDYGRIHEIVPEKNRILNADTPWSHYVMLTGQWEDSQPQDGYDGANVGDSRSWGVVDDTSDGEIVARVAWRHRRFQARARFFTGPPDYAPDRRPVYSIADDLAERELPPPSTNEDDLPVVTGEVLDMFERAFETASLFNLDAARTRAIQENEARLSGSRQTIPDAPKYDGQSFTASDTPYVDVSPSLVMSEKATPLGPSLRPYSCRTQSWSTPCTDR